MVVRCGRRGNDGSANWSPVRRVVFVWLAMLYLAEGGEGIGETFEPFVNRTNRSINITGLRPVPSSTDDHKLWVPVGQGACAVLGHEGAYGPNLVHPVATTEKCLDYANAMGQTAATIYGAGFCMVHFPTLMDGYQCPYRMKIGWIVDCDRRPHPAMNWTNDGIKGMECFLLETLPPPSRPEQQQ